MGLQPIYFWLTCPDHDFMIKALFMTKGYFYILGNSTRNLLVKLNFDKLVKRTENFELN